MYLQKICTLFQTNHVILVMQMLLVYALCIHWCTDRHIVVAFCM
uniref:Uncharacterized protein n=1 Tax=Ciona intestinalis TaxID=7719 RepID=H2XPJ0_CIOIN